MHIMAIFGIVVLSIFIVGALIAFVMLIPDFFRYTKRMENLAAKLGRAQDAEERLTLLKQFRLLLRLADGAITQELPTDDD